MESPNKRWAFENNKGESNSPLLFSLLLHPENAAEQGREKAGGSHEYDLHSRTPFLMFGKYVSGAQQQPHTEDAEKGLGQDQCAQSAGAKGGGKARGAFGVPFDGIHGSTSFAFILCTKGLMCS